MCDYSLAGMPCSCRRAVGRSQVFHRPSGDRVSEENAGVENRAAKRMKRQREKGFMKIASLRDGKGSDLVIMKYTIMDFLGGKKVGDTSRVAFGREFDKGGRKGYFQ